MKCIMFVMLLVSSLTGVAFASETTTECIMMQEVNVRSNPKENLVALKPKTKNVKSSEISSQ
jgi:hypothetical protein